MKNWGDATTVATLLLLMATVYADDDDWYPCRSDVDCEYDECCIQSRFVDYKTCRDRGDDPGDLCGGSRFCPCEFGYVCQPHPPERANNRWFQGSNGTCMYDVAAYRGSALAGYRNAQLRSGYVRDWDDLDDLWDHDDRRR